MLALPRFSLQRFWTLVKNFKSNLSVIYWKSFRFYKMKNLRDEYLINILPNISKIQVNKSKQKDVPLQGARCFFNFPNDCHFYRGTFLLHWSKNWNTVSYHKFYWRLNIWKSIWRLNIWILWRLNIWKIMICICKFVLGSTDVHHQWLLLLQLFWTTSYNSVSFWLVLYIISSGGK